MVRGHECSLRRLGGAWEELWCGGREVGVEFREVTEGKEEEGKEVEKRRGGEARKLVAHGS